MANIYTMFRMYYTEQDFFKLLKHKTMPNDDWPINLPASE